ncbi:Uncharacterised protein [Acinetobacter baumannii]|uniref:Uncharacterized protein n=1 Tax=Acinetobacter phage AbTZA1 TaxID=2500827 RepID=A0A3Q9R7J0_9CAUD|nr:hypothetical protein HYP74_gp003 [Acinetobacter phage AbTZA1]AZU98755.1 hypothetical protein [Acinetobacter phage AbTZA1]QQM13828.1 hypothetical protein CPT_Maestro_094 [Acinetobacter phage Maestro]QQM18584.1 hypothetical protein CPT_Morttis_091 [Acinetobacter phage Morttis]SSU39358.1 Uncharacterised protein [Acinetobacter baumannii]
MNIFNQIRIANENAENFSEAAALWYRVVVGVGICIPLLFIVGFITGALMFKNPLAAGSELVNAMF